MRIFFAIALYIFQMTTTAQADDLSSTTQAVKQIQPGMPQKSAKEIYRMVKKPENAIELLENIKLAVDDGLVLRQDFYTKENMHNFFGAIGERVDLFPYEGNTIISIRGGDFGYPIKSSLQPLVHDRHPYIKDEYILNGAQFSGGINILPDGKTKGSIGFDFEEYDAPTAEDIEKVFGKNWRQFNPMRTDGPPPMATAPHGNENWDYPIESNLGNGGVGFQFLFNGTLVEAGMFLKQR